jgi:hypothetical protein
MSKLKSALALALAALATPVVLATFMGMGTWAKALAEGTGVVISPWYTGGEVARTVAHEGHRTLVRRPVFDGLIGPRAEGFVQVEWTPDEGKALPAALREEVDADGDGRADFVVDLDTVANRGNVAPLSPAVLGLERVYDLGAERAVRVRLRRVVSGPKRPAVR